MKEKNLEYFIQKIKEFNYTEIEHNFDNTVIYKKSYLPKQEIDKLNSKNKLLTLELKNKLTETIEEIGTNYAIYIDKNREVLSLIKTHIFRKKASIKIESINDMVFKIDIENIKDFSILFDLFKF